MLATEVGVSSGAMKPRDVLPRVMNYLRGLTPSRLGIVLAICLLFTARQHSLCAFQVACGMAAGQSLSGFLTFVARQFVFALPFLILVTVADNATSVDPRAGLRILALSCAVILGSFIHGVAFFYTQPPNVLNGATGREWVFILAYSSRGLLYGGLATAVLYLFARERHDARARHSAKLEKLALERQMIEARLQALQAQIEPHFLFNTLANIKMLYVAESSRAKPLIHDLGEYLRTALPLMRDIRSTLGRELDLCLAFLRVLEVRMDDRLKVVVDVPAELRAATLPPMMLLTLVENAVKHGIAPLTRGGTITIRARRSSTRLWVNVLDDGVGFPKGYGSGVGLANTRARLAALYGETGQLVLDANEHGGVVATLALPFDSGTAVLEPA
jgi:hypothetical protein